MILKVLAKRKVLITWNNIFKVSHVLDLLVPKNDHFLLFLSACYSFINLKV